MVAVLTLAEEMRIEYFYKLSEPISLDFLSYGWVVLEQGYLSFYSAVEILGQKAVLLPGWLAEETRRKFDCSLLHGRGNGLLLWLGYSL